MIKFPMLATNRVNKTISANNKTFESVCIVFGLKVKLCKGLK